MLFLNSLFRNSFLLLVATELLFSRATLGAWPQDPVLNVPVCTAPGDQDFPSLVPDGQGGAIICWHDWRLGYPRIGVFAQRMDGSGVPRWTPDGVSLSESSNQKVYPILVEDGAGGAFIAWSEAPGVDEFPDIYAQHIDATGELLWGPTGALVCAAAWGQFPSAIVRDESGGVIIAWMDGRDFTFQTYVQRLSATGQRLWNPNGVALTSNATGGQSTTAGMIPDGSGGAIVCWEDSRNYFGDVFVQRIAADGGSLWSAGGVALTSLFAAQRPSSIVSDGSGGAIVAWQDERTGYGDVYAGRVDANGVRQWAMDGVPVCTAGGYQWSPKLVADGAGGAFISWEDDRSTPQTGRDIYGQHIDAEGASSWSIDGVPVCSNESWQYGPVLAPDGAGGLFITWGDQRNGLNDLFAQRLDAAGHRLWEEDGRPVSISPGDQSAFAAMVSDGLGGAIVTWHDRRRETETDIYAQRIGDTTPLTIEVVPSPALLWPSNHDLIPIGVDVNVKGGSGTSPSINLISVSSSEPDQSSDPEDVPGDIQGADVGEPDFEFALRAERDGDGPGRDYEICYEAREGNDDAVTNCAVVRVPHDRRGRAMLSLSGAVWRLTILSDSRFPLHSISVETIRLWSSAAGSIPIVPSSHEYGDSDGDGSGDLTVFLVAPAVNGSALTGNSYVVRWEAGGVGYQAPIKVENVTGVGDADLVFAARIARNPAQHSASIHYALPQAGDVDLSIYDVTGKRVARLAQGWRAAGNHRAFFKNPESRGSQIYWYRLEWLGRQVTGKFVLFP